MGVGFWGSKLSGFRQDIDTIPKHISIAVPESRGQVLISPAKLLFGS